ncbi:hypothetical protein AU252_05130 [Pseudarthrobacter sulfonivorans]|uniref:Uncharacterized protein n=1 Tax=Pseudarthrobacter sulfonivorans TaxID=121292 RepID=A0A0U3QK00_9MICC|nr:hypothetical protein [Pseudarthrobacter sulfonivorans]ALV40628.1 hypothetical protein AU252_05130 [Pseudarthrobacter sulfonivorans]
MEFLDPSSNRFSCFGAGEGAIANAAFGDVFLPAVFGDDEAQPQCGRPSTFWLGAPLKIVGAFLYPSN